MPVINGETVFYPIIGDPIVYVRSPERLTASFAAAGHNGICIPMQVPEGQLPAVMAGLSAISNAAGILVTMPHKFGAFAHCLTSSTTSRLLQNVSVMRRNADGSWHGDMLDGRAFVQAQLDAGAQVAGSRVLLIGAGGAGSAIGVAMLEAGAREVVVADRSRERADRLVGILSVVGSAVAGAPDSPDCDIVCNATPMGMSADDPLPFDVSSLRPPQFVGDVIAGHGETALLRAARLRGCKTAGGDQMVDAVQDMMVRFMLHVSDQDQPPS